jgi:uncharacterized Zn-binding protein involved in type VI secretion
MAGEIIRLGDPTSHGGKVIEGSQVDICHGKPIAYLGHKTFCPKCKGMFPIVDGAPTTTFYGKGVALAGMKTACGAVLIATQFTDVVEHGVGAGAGAIATSGADRNTQISDRGGMANTIAIAPSASGSTPRTNADEYDLYFQVTDKTGAPMTAWPYRIEMAGGVPVEGRTDSKGLTSKIASTSAELAILHVYEPDATPINPNWDR